MVAELPSRSASDKRPVVFPAFSLFTRHLLSLRTAAEAVEQNWGNIFSAHFWCGLNTDSVLLACLLQDLCFSFPGHLCYQAIYACVLNQSTWILFDSSSNNCTDQHVDSCKVGFRIIIVNCLSTETVSLYDRISYVGFSWLCENPLRVWVSFLTHTLTLAKLWCIIINANLWVICYKYIPYSKKVGTLSKL